MILLQKKDSSMNETTAVSTLSLATLSIGIILIIAAYLMGSLSSAIIYCKLRGLPDPRTVGSGNPGVTNILRMDGKVAAFCVLVGDVLKGVIPVLLAKLFELNPWIIGLTACAALLGHLYPVFFRFQGGKGVATAAGVCLALNWPFGLAVIFIWLLVVIITRTSSLGALAAAAAAPVLAYILIDWEIATLLLAISALLIWRHQPNIERIRAGIEPKIGEKEANVTENKDN
jgi:glycerol-3-phosphate acyltransferase PlsY